MSAWVVIPSLLSLREEFNAISPNRDKGSDGTIGDTSHTSSSDHSPDEDSSALRNKDSDSTNEVHGLDIDSTGPWPAGRSFDSIVKGIIAREKARWLDPDDMCRLRYIIWNRKMYHIDNDFNPVDYTLSDPHTNHAHFSARYGSGNGTGNPENDTSPWGVKEADMPLDSTDLANVKAKAREAFAEIMAEAKAASIDGNAPGVTATGRQVRDAFYQLGVTSKNEVLAKVGETQVLVTGVLAKVTEDDGEFQQMMADANAKFEELKTHIGDVDDAVFSRLSDPNTPNEQVAQVLSQLLGDRKNAVLALMQD